MKKAFIFFGIFLFVCIIFTIFFNIDSNKNQGNASDTPNPENKTNLIYVVKEYNGNIAIFEDHSDTPFKITDIRLSDLPDGDKKLLSKGIQASNSQELNCILEDYCS